MTASLGRDVTFDDQAEFVSNVLVEVFDDQGVLKDYRAIHNLVVTAGKNHIAAFMAASPPAAMGWMELGTGATAAAAGDTLLQTALAASRVALTSRTSATNVTTYVGDWPAGTSTNTALTEAGIFNVATANTITMLARAVFTAINKGASDTLKITWTVTFA